MNPMRFRSMIDCPMIAMICPTWDTFPWYVALNQKKEQQIKRSGHETIMGYIPIIFPWPYDPYSIKNLHVWRVRICIWQKDTLYTYIPNTFPLHSYGIPKKFPFPMTSPACFPFLSHINRLSMPMVLTFRFLFRSQECDTNSDGLISREDRHHMEKDIMGFIVFWCWVASKIQCLAMLDNDRHRKKTPGSSFWKMDSESWCIFVVRQSPG